MRIALPDDTIALAKSLQASGDQAAISRHLTRNEKNPEGDVSRAKEVSNALKTGMGEHDLVYAITDFYLEKKKLVDNINSRFSTEQPA